MRSATLAGLCLLLGVTASGLAQARPASADAYDLIITGGRIVDGTGAPARLADIGIRGRWIARITVPGGLGHAAARDRIDASGLVVAPGFVDVHSHAPEAMFDTTHKLNEGVVRMGVTTVVGGPDGGASPALMKTFIGLIGQAGAGTNVALYVGHNGIREAVMGAVQRAPTGDELARMKAMVREGMELGAVGLSSGLMYEPGMFSTTDEVVELAKEVTPFHGIYDSHVRDPVKRFLESDQECIEVGERAGIAPKIAHEKAVSLENAGKIRDVIAMVEAARARGVNATTDQYPYDGAATALLPEIVVVPKAMTEAAGFDLKAALRDPATRAALKQTSEHGIDGGFAWIKATGYSSMRVTTSPGDPRLVGRYLSQLATERKQDPFDLVSDLVLGAAEPIGITLGALQEQDLRDLLVQRWNMIASDGEYSDAKSSGPGHPRSTGTFPRVLGHYVREAKLLSLEDAVRKMTSLPADFVGLHDRGRLAEGQAADIVVFNAGTVGDRSTWAEPWATPVGIPHVIVNGIPVLRNGSLTGAAPGTYLRARH